MNFDAEWEKAFILGVEFGYKQGEKGNNIQQALINASAAMNSTKPKSELQAAARNRARKIRENAQ